MPAYAELDLVTEGENYEIRTHNVNRQDSTKASYTWPKVRITGPVDWNIFMAEWSEAVESEGDLESLVSNCLNHGISVQKDPDRESADPTIKEFKARFRHAISLHKSDKAMALQITATLKEEDPDLLADLKQAHRAKIMSQIDIID